MRRILLRSVVVCLGFVLLLTIAQRLTEYFSRPSTVMRLEAHGRTSDGREIHWTLSVDKQRLMDLDGRPISDLDMIRRSIAEVLPNGELTIEAEVFQDLDEKQIAAVVERLAEDREHPRLALSKVPGMVGRLQQFWRDGGQFGRQSAAQFRELVEAGYPTSEEIVAAQRAAVKVSARLAELRQLEEAGDQTARKLKALGKELTDAQSSEDDLGEVSAEDVEDVLVRVGEEIQEVEARGLERALVTLTQPVGRERPKLSANKVLGLLADLKQLEREGAAVESLSAKELEARLNALRPTADEWEAVYRASCLLARRWTLTVSGGQVAIDGREATVADLEARVAQYAVILGPGEEGTRAATIDDVLRAAREGKLVAPSRPYVSFPGRMTYEQARPENEGPYVYPVRAEKPDFVITKFSDAPILHSKALQNKLKIRDYVDGSDPQTDDDWDNLPPVADRLPKNPAVMVGPDGEGPNHVGRYGGRWVRASSDDWDLSRKIGYPSFVRFDPKGDLQPHFAYKWSVTDNNRVFTFYLRPGHRWSDGEPWTAHDIAFVCNTVIGSEYWSDASDWMMETDGSLLLYPDDVKDWPALAERILREMDSPEPSIGRQMAKVVDGEIRSVVDRMVEAETLPAAKADRLVSELRSRGLDVLKLAEVPAVQIMEEFGSLQLSRLEAEAVQGAVGQLRLIKLRSLLQTVTPTSLPDDLTKAKIVSALNKLMESPRFYDPAAWRGVDLDAEYQALMDKGPSKLTPPEAQRLEFLTIRKDVQKRLALSARFEDLERRKASGGLSESEQAIYDRLAQSEKWLRLGAGDLDLGREIQWLKKFNVMMLRAAWADLLTPPVKERVKVTALDDHTIEFRFKKPSALFLMKMATFMNYRGMFDTSIHFSRRIHPDATQELIVDDILDWKGFLAKVVMEGESDTPSPSRQLWLLMSDDLRDKFRQTPPADDPKDAWKQSVIDGLNKIMTNERGFYTAEAWKGVDLTSELAKLRDVGYTRLKDNRLRRRYMALVRIEDMLRRGPADLEATGRDAVDNSLLVFNVAMFRAAFSAPAADFFLPDDDQDAYKVFNAKQRNQASLVAYDRENALDVVAQRDELQFETWTDRARAFSGKLRTRYHVPTLCPWRIVTDPMDLKTVAIRNPYYFAVDAEGNQLPYLDVFINEKQTTKPVRLMKLTSGNVSFDCRELFFEDFTTLKQNEAAGGYKVYLWPNDYCGELTFYFPLARKDKELEKLQSDSRFRKALSYAINRQEIIDVIYRGIGEPAQWSVPKGSKFYNEKHATMAVAYRPDLANKMLDEMGLDKRNSEGTRLLWSGEPLNMDVVTVQERPLDAVQMVCNYWRAIGVNAQMKVQNSKYINNAIAIGILDIGVHKEGGNYFGPVYAGGFAPIHPAECGWGSKWVEWLRTGGTSGWEPPDYIKELDVQWTKVAQSPTEEDLIRNWKELTDGTADWLPWIGVMTSPGIPVYVKNGFKNVPKISLAGWMAHEPGNNCPEVFYWEKEQD